VSLQLKQLLEAQDGAIEINRTRTNVTALMDLNGDGGEVH
jgi:hypothetical protein